MRWFKWMGMLLGVGILLGACSSKKLSESDQLLVDYLVQDYQTYFDFPLVLNDFERLKRLLLFKSFFIS